MFGKALLVALVFVSSSAAADIISGGDKKTLLAEIASNVSLPTGNYVYSQDASELSSFQIDWRDVARYYAACQASELNKHATLVDLEVIRFIWLENKGQEDKAARKVKRLLGPDIYSHASAAYAGSAYDCLNETSTHVKDLIER